ncbi:MAG: hypothetical protein IJR99_02760 [Kiritimatiellae bacterium]|nr:hypothetical protein [Kiritimatiellia bacterium]
MKGYEDACRRCPELLKPVGNTFRTEIGKRLSEALAPKKPEPPKSDPPPDSFLTFDESDELTQRFVTLQLAKQVKKGEIAVVYCTAENKELHPIQSAGILCFATTRHLQTIKGNFSEFSNLYIYSRPSSSFYYRRVMPNGVRHDSCLPAPYRPRLIPDDHYARLVFLEKTTDLDRRLLVRPDGLMGEYTQMAIDATNLTQQAFFEKHNLTEIFSNRVYRAVDDCIFHVDYPLPEKTFASEREKRLWEWKRDDRRQQYKKKLMHLSPEEVSEIVWIAYRLEGEKGVKGYEDACRRCPQLLKPVGKTFRTKIGRELADTLSLLEKQMQNGAYQPDGRSTPTSQSCPPPPPIPVSVAEVANPKLPVLRGWYCPRFAYRMEGNSWPGDGYPGKIEPYPVTPELRKPMSEYRMTAWTFHREKVYSLSEGYNYYITPHNCPTNFIPYLLFTPQNPQRRKLPLVLYFGGLGEYGYDLERQFRHRTIFAKVTGKAFQERHPCHLFAPMLPKNAQLHSCTAECPDALSDLVNDTLSAVIRQVGEHTVDTNRLYVTGFSAGGDAACMMLSGYPGRYAACVPVSVWMDPNAIPKEKPGNYWLLFNDEDMPSDEMRKEREFFAETVRKRGGEYRSSSYPKKGHNAWDTAWREDAVWDWMFSKTADGTPVREIRPKSATGILAQTGNSESKPIDSSGVVCTASITGRGRKTMPQFAADGLDGTAYVSATPAARGDWLVAEFPEPFAGNVTVKTGYRNGKGRLSSGRTEVSPDGKTWRYVGTFSRTTGECTFQTPGKIRFVRVLPTPRQQEPLVVREISVQRK